MAARLILASVTGVVREFKMKRSGQGCASFAQRRQHLQYFAKMMPTFGYSADICGIFNLIKIREKLTEQVCVRPPTISRSQKGRQRPREVRPHHACVVRSVLKALIVIRSSLGSVLRVLMVFHVKCAMTGTLLLERRSILS